MGPMGKILPMCIKNEYWHCKLVLYNTVQINSCNSAFNLLYY